MRVRFWLKANHCPARLEASFKFREEVFGVWRSSGTSGVGGEGIGGGGG